MTPAHRVVILKLNIHVSETGGAQVEHVVAHPRGRLDHCQADGETDTRTNGEGLLFGSPLRFCWLRLEKKKHERGFEVAYPRLSYNCLMMARFCCGESIPLRTSAAHSRKHSLGSKQRLSVIEKRWLRGLWRARSRLYRSRFLQVNTHLAVF